MPKIVEVDHNTVAMARGKQSPEFEKAVEVYEDMRAGTWYELSEFETTEERARFVQYLRQSVRKGYERLVTRVSKEDQTIVYVKLELLGVDSKPQVAETRAHDVTREDATAAA